MPSIPAVEGEGTRVPCVPVMSYWGVPGTVCAGDVVLGGARDHVLGAPIVGCRPGCCPQRGCAEAVGKQRMIT